MVDKKTEDQRIRDKFTWKKGDLKIIKKGTPIPKKGNK